MERLLHQAGRRPGTCLPAILRTPRRSSVGRLFAWAAWAASANRPGKDYSYTNNWPYEPLVGNRPSAAAYVWSALSLVTLLGVWACILFMVGKFGYLGWKGEGDTAHVTHCAPAALTLTPSPMGHRVVLCRGGAPLSWRNRSWEARLPTTVWSQEAFTASTSLGSCPTLWYAPGISNSPSSGSQRLGRRRPFPGVLVGGEEPSGQKAGVYALLGALVVVVFGSLFGEYLGINDSSAPLVLVRASGFRIPGSRAVLGSSCWRRAWSSGFF